MRICTCLVLKSAIYCMYRISININNYLELPYKDILEKLDTECIVYIVLKPYNFEDCGREFANTYNLIKWSDTDNITYS